MKKKILIVDDSDLIAGILTGLLTNAGYEVSRAAHGLEGIQKVYEWIPDLIIMDVDMPTLQGYQTSRLIKSRRGIKDIPIIMHTSHSEDRDKFWGYDSGADAFVAKDFDNAGPLLQKVKELSQSHAPYLVEAIQEDAKKISISYIMEMLSGLYDQELFQAVILNELSNVARSIRSVSETTEKICFLLQKICEAHIIVVNLHYHKSTLSFIKPSRKVYTNEANDFFDLCLHDFLKHCPGSKKENVEKNMLGVAGREIEPRAMGHKNKIVSYLCSPLIASSHGVIGTLHIGVCINNYFSETICSHLASFTKGAGVIFENALLLKHIYETEHSIRTVFSKFVPAEIIDDLISKLTTSSVRVGEKRRVAVLFSDIRSFTTISENNPPEKVVSLLNTYFEVMVSIIHKQGGTVDKFIGDAILAIFGAPQSYEDNSRRAIAAALEMIHSLPKVETGEACLPETGLKIGIGIHEGDVIVGNLGSKEKFSYTVIGDTVNLASRLEGITKHYKMPIIVSQDVKEKLPPEYLLREIDSVKVKGKEKPTLLYGIDPSLPAQNEEAMKNYTKALSMYKIKNFGTALEYFNRALTQLGDDHLCKMYVHRCNEYLKNPPPNDWDGTHALDFK